MDNEEIQGVKFSEFSSATPDNADEVVGLHAGDNARFSVANFILAIRQGLANLFVPLTRTINSKPLSSDITLDASDVGAVDTADVGVADGVASLDSTGKVPSSQLPPISSDASDITYDPTTSGLAATDVQAAIDEVQGEIDNLPSPPDPSDTNPQDLGTAAAGSSSEYSRADHVHNKPTAADIGAYVKPSGGIPATDLASGVIPTVPSAYTSNPEMDGTASPGSSGAWARGDHVHPSDTSRVPVYGMGKNLLRNWYFVGGGTGRGVFPVNQRGQSSYSNATYTVDGWRIRQAGNSLQVNSSGVTFFKGSTYAQCDFHQYIDNATLAQLLGKRVTATILWDSTHLDTVAFTWVSGNPSVMSGTGWQLFCGGTASVFTNFCIRCSTTSLSVQAVKLELGTEQTLAHQENGTWVLNEIPDYEEELLKCQRYFLALLPNGSTPLVGNGISISATQATIMIPTPVPMRSTTPVVTFSGVLKVWHGSVYGSTAPNLTAFVNPAVGSNGIGTTIQVASGLTAGEPVMLQLRDSSPAIYISCEM